MRSDEEFELFYKILARLGLPQDFTKHVNSSAIGVIKNLEEGKKHLFLEALDVFESRQQWDMVYDLCLQALQPTGPDGSPSLSASNWGVWRKFIAAAAKQPDADAQVHPCLPCSSAIPADTNKALSKPSRGLCSAFSP